MILKLILPIIFILSFYVSPAGAEDRASALFKSSIPSVFQIVVVDKRSQEKESIGTGFRLESGAGMPLLATNYHVIADITRYPANYDIQYRAEDGRSGLLELVAVDVARDLAILTSEDKSFSAIPGLLLSGDALTKGQDIFAIGNPHDKGMIVVEGAYGGTISNEFYTHIVFSGASLNPGMSGGPAVNESGKVVGVNVSIEANDINYLVPVAALRSLVENARQEDTAPPRSSNEWRKTIARQVLDRQRAGIEALLKVTPEIMDLKGFSFPRNLDPSFKCWGGGEDRGQKVNFDEAWLVCRQESDIYLKDGLSTGTIRYALAHVDGASASRLGFDYEYADNYGSAWLSREKDEVDVTAFACDSGFTRHGGENWKTAICSRGYKGYPGLYDVYFSSALLGHARKGYYYKVSLEGVDKELARSFLSKLTEKITWKK